MGPACGQIGGSERWDQPVDRPVGASGGTSLWTPPPGLVEVQRRIKPIRGLPRKGHLTPGAVQLGPPSPDPQLSKLRGNTVPGEELGLNSATSSWPSHLPLQAHRPATCPGPHSRKGRKCCNWQCLGFLQERPYKSRPRLRAGCFKPQVHCG